MDNTIMFKFVNIGKFFKMAMGNFKLGIPSNKISLNLLARQN